jgi:hypothetical protein
MALKFTPFQSIDYSSRTQSGDTIDLRPSLQLLNLLSAVADAERKEITAGLMGHPLGCHWCTTAIQHKIISVDIKTILPHLALYDYNRGGYLSSHMKFCPVLIFMSHAKKRQVIDLIKGHCMRCLSRITGNTRCPYCANNFHEYNICGFHSLLCTQNHDTANKTLDSKRNIYISKLEELQGYFPFTYPSFRPNSNADDRVVVLFSSLITTRNELRDFSVGSSPP